MIRINTLVLVPVGGTAVLPGLVVGRSFKKRTLTVVAVDGSIWKGSVFEVELAIR